MNSRITKAATLGACGLIGITSIGLLGATQSAHAATTTSGVTLTETMCTVIPENRVTPIPVDLATERINQEIAHEQRLATETANFDSQIATLQARLDRRTAYLNTEYRISVDKAKNRYATSIQNGTGRAQAKKVRNRKINEAKAVREKGLTRATDNFNTAAAPILVQKETITEQIMTPSAIPGATQRIVDRDRVQVTWTAPTWAGDTIIDTYIVREGGTEVGRGNFTNRSITLTVPAGTSKAITIEPVNENGHAGPAYTFTASSPTTTTPAATFNTLTPSGNGYTLTLGNINTANGHSATVIGPTGTTCVLDVNAKTLKVVNPMPYEQSSVKVASQSATAQPGTAFFSYYHAITPTVSDLTPTADGFQAMIMSTRPNVTYTATVNGTGTARFTGNRLTVTGVPAGQTRTVTITENTQSGPSITITATGTALSPAPTPNLTNATPVADGTGFTFAIRNYSDLPANGWTVSSTAGTATIGANGVVTVTGLTDGQSATVTVTATRSGLTSTATVTGNASAQATEIITTDPTYTAAGRATFNVTNHDKFSELFVKPNSLDDTSVSISLDPKTGAVEATNLPANKAVTFTITGQVNGAATTVEKTITLTNVQVVEEAIKISDITYLDDSTAQFTITNWNDFVEGVQEASALSTHNGATVNLDWATATYTVSNIPADTDVVLVLRGQPDPNSSNTVSRTVTLRINK